MLAGAGFGDDARLAHSYGEQALADGVVDFVRAGVEQIFALEVDARAAELRSEASGELQRRGAAGEIFQQIVRIRLETAASAFRGFVGALEFEERHHQRFGNVAAAVGAEATGGGGGMVSWVVMVELFIVLRVRGFRRGRGGLQTAADLKGARLGRRPLQGGRKPV